MRALFLLALTSAAAVFLAACDGSATSRHYEPAFDRPYQGGTETRERGD